MKMNKEHENVNRMRLKARQLIVSRSCSTQKTDIGRFPDLSTTTSSKDRQILVNAIKEGSGNHQMIIIQIVDQCYKRMGIKYGMRVNQIYDLNGILICRRESSFINETWIELDQDVYN